MVVRPDNEADEGTKKWPLDKLLRPFSAQAKAADCTFLFEASLNIFSTQNPGKLGVTSRF